MRCSTGLKTRYTAALRTCFVWPIIEGVGVKNWCHIMLAEKDIGARGWVGLGWYIIPKPTADSASNGGSMSTSPSCGIQSNTQALPTEYYHGVLVNRSFHLAASTTLIAGRPCHYNPCSGLNGQQSMPRQSHKTFKA